MIQEIQVRVLPVVASSEQNIKRFVAEDRGIDIRTINAVRVLKRSIDARQRKIFINLTVRLLCGYGIWRRERQAGCHSGGRGSWRTVRFASPYRVRTAPDSLGAWKERERP